MPGFVVTDSVAGGFRNIRSASAAAVPVPDGLSWNNDNGGDDNDDEDDFGQQGDGRVRVEVAPRLPASVLQKSNPSRNNLFPYCSDSGPDETFAPSSRGPPILSRGASASECPSKTNVVEKQCPQFDFCPDARQGNTIDIGQMDPNCCDVDVSNDENEDQTGYESRLPLLGLSTTSSDRDLQIPEPNSYMGLEAAMETKTYRGTKQGAGSSISLSEKPDVKRKQNDQSTADMIELEQKSLETSELLRFLPKETNSGSSW